MKGRSALILQYLDFNEARGTVVRFIFYTNQSTVPKEYMTQ